jgi:hypothetical protein
MRWHVLQGYILKRSIWVAYNRIPGCACIFSLNNGTFGIRSFGMVGMSFKKGII